MDTVVPAPSLKSQTFAEAHAFYSDFFEVERPGEITMDEDTDKDVLQNEKTHRFREAAAAFQDNMLWKAAKQHLRVKDDSGCRMAIDFIILDAIKLAQKEISQNEAVDLALRARHHLEEHNWRDPEAGEAGSWVGLHHKVKIDTSDQVVLPGIALHGVLDLVMTVIPACDAKDALQSAARHLTMNALYAPQNFQKRPQIAPRHRGRRGERRQTYGERRVLEGGGYAGSFPLRLYGQAVAKIPDPDSKPFKVASTRMLDISQDLAIVIRLLTLAMLWSAEQFAELAGHRVASSS
ncbi:hypothetical protein MSAN_01625100 [Mycena sanguinolenta]|uniref:Uncharacterized protein n=1 Tax=Mycena sanguinolenta TaxID=230812 RepID=A0A8H6XZT5_9AGAR|nr:hypothetical protein MSAN_01625100 [Mycena sanguinolenta]